jgi:hypothetical protein
MLIVNGSYSKRVGVDSAPSVETKSSRAGSQKRPRKPSLNSSGAMPTGPDATAVKLARQALAGSGGRQGAGRSVGSASCTEEKNNEPMTAQEAYKEAERLAQAAVKEYEAEMKQAFGPYAGTDCARRVYANAYNRAAEERWFRDAVYGVEFPGDLRR